MHLQKKLKRKKRVVVSVTTDLNTDQRVQKVCKTLHKNGFEVLLIGRFLRDSTPAYYPFRAVQMKLFFTKKFLFYANFNIRLFFKLLFTRKDILLSNDLDTLLSNYLVSKICRKKLVYDSHELFTELPELVDRPFVKTIWTFIERSILPKLTHCYTVCGSISNYYENLYGTKFGIINNFPLKILKSRHVNDETPTGINISDEKIILYQGALNVKRGLELMIEAMNFIEKSILVIVGGGPTERDLKKQVRDLKLENKVKFLSKLPPHELQKITPKADLGISLEEDKGLNYRYALPNKLFDYIQAHVPVLVSDLPEMKKIVEQYDVGEIVKSREPQNLASQVTELLKRKKNYQPALEKASKDLIWENQEKVLLSYFE